MNQNGDVRVLQGQLPVQVPDAGQGGGGQGPGLKCGHCGQDRDTQSHCMVCPAWTQARDRLEFSDIDDVVTYFQRVLRGREDKEKDMRKRTQGE